MSIDRWLLGAVLCLLCLVAPDAATAETTANPFGAAATVEAAPPAAPETARTGMVFEIRRWIAMAQRDVNRAINERLVAIKRGEDRGALWGGIVFAFLYGVFHAIGPGHGKSVVIGYFLGRAARPWRGVAMAGWIALSHVVGAVVIVGIAHLILSRALASPTNEYLWLRSISYGAILLIGLFMLRGWWRERQGQSHHGKDNAHHHGHGHGHACAAGEAAWLDEGKPLEQRLLALAAGLVPCSGAILILLFTLANGLVLAGIAMAVAIAAGMGITLAGLGIGSILLRRQLALRLPQGGRATRWLALAGPVFVILIGGGLLVLGLTGPSNY